MNKKFFVLLWIYASWIAAALFYNKKSPSEINSELEKATKSGDDKIKVLFNNFIEIHKNLLHSFKTKLLTTENKEIFNEKKDELISLFWDFKNKAEKIFEEYKVSGKDYANEWLDKLDKFYNEKIDELEKLKDIAPKKIEEAKSKVINYYNEIKSKMKI